MSEEVINVLFLIGTGLIALHGLTYRDKDGDRPIVHLLFGAIALLYFMWVLGRDVLNLF